MFVSLSILNTHPSETFLVLQCSDGERARCQSCPPILQQSPKHSADEQSNNVGEALYDHPPASLLPDSSEELNLSAENFNKQQELQFKDNFYEISRVQTKDKQTDKRQMNDKEWKKGIHQMQKSLLRVSLRSF